MPRITSKIGATLKGKNLLPLRGYSKRKEFAPRGSKFFPLRAAPMKKKQTVLCKNHFVINIFLRMLRACVMCIMSAMLMTHCYTSFS